MNSERYDFLALVEAWRDRRRWGEAHADLSQYFNLRYCAFAAAFSVDLDKCPEAAPPMPDWMKARIAHASLPRDDSWHEVIHVFLLRAERESRQLSGPFAGYLEMPPELAAVYDHFATSIAAPLTATGAAISNMLSSLLVALYPEAANRVISTHDLALTGSTQNARHRIQTTTGSRTRE
jgi:hypothetical protein